MIGGCLISTAYPFLADVYTKKRTVTKSGAVHYDWQFYQTINCLVRPFVSTSFKAQGTNEDFGAEYDKLSYLKLLSKEVLGRNVQVTNIRDKGTGEVVYAEVELKNSPPTWYNSNGSSPVLDPYGRIIEWDTTIHRAETQGDVSV